MLSVSEADSHRRVRPRGVLLALLMACGLARDLPRRPPPTLASIAPAVQTPSPGTQSARDPVPVRQMARGPTRSGPSHATPPWSRWLQAANDGDPGAACRLAVLLDDCRRVHEVDAMVETQVSVAAAGTGESTREAGEIVRLQASVEAQRERCAGVPATLRQHDADFVLRAALAGHAPSMLRYLTDPPLAAPSPAERAAALASYRQYAPDFLEELLQRGSREALGLAFRIAQGEEFVAGAPVQPRDAAAAVRYGTALLYLYEDDPATRIGVDTALGETDTASAHRAQGEGQELARRFLAQAAVLAAPGGDPDGCTNGWPRAPRATTAAAH